MLASYSGNMNAVDEAEDKGPLIDSQDKDERISARRLRIRNKMDAAKRAALGEDVEVKKVVKPELRKTERQMEESRQRLAKLKLDGIEMVTNVQTAADSRETKRRIEHAEIINKRIELLKAEAVDNKKKFDEITKKWDDAMSRDLPDELHKKLLEQKADCETVINAKNKLINDLQMEMREKDEFYVKELKKQSEDVNLTVERMEDQLKSISKIYAKEIGEIEHAFDTERRELIENSQKKLEEAIKDRQNKEVDYYKNQELQSEEYQASLQSLRLQDQEEFKQIKIKLETDVQVLEQQLQQMKATYQLNQERLEYNFQVLKKRDEENAITKSQQKRKITRMQDMLNQVKHKLAKQEKQYSDENIGLTDDYKRIAEQLQDLQRKTKHFHATDTKKFYDVWCMNESQAKDLVNTVLNTDSLIHKQQLGLPWKRPELAFMENTGPITSINANKKLHPAIVVAEETIKSVNEMKFAAFSLESIGESSAELSDNKPESNAQSATEAVKSRSSISVAALPKLSAEVKKKIFELLSSESNFLVEDKVEKLLSPRNKDEQLLIRLDAIFSVIGVKSADDMEALMPYFVKKQSEARSHILAVSNISRLQVSGQEVPDYGCVLIEPNDALVALREFAEEHNKPIKPSTKQDLKMAAVEFRDNSDDTAYWKAYVDSMSGKRCILWDALFTALEKYRGTLQQRAKLLEDTQGLRRQNFELRTLLQKHINEKRNDDLVIPPTRTMGIGNNQKQTTSPL